MATLPRLPLLGILLLLAVTLSACGSSATAPPPTAAPPTVTAIPRVAADVALEPLAATLLAVSHELHGGAADLQYASDALGVQLTQSAQINTSQAQEYFKAARSLLRSFHPTGSYTEIARLLAASNVAYSGAGAAYGSVVNGHGASRQRADTEIRRGQRLLAQADALLALRPETKLIGVQGSATALATSALQAATPRIVHRVVAARQQKRRVVTLRPWSSPTPTPAPPVLAVVIRPTPTATVTPVPPTPLPTPRPVVSSVRHRRPRLPHQAPQVAHRAPPAVRSAHHPLVMPTAAPTASPTATPPANATAVAALAEQRDGLLVIVREVQAASGRLGRAERRIVQATASADYDPIMLARAQADVGRAESRLRLIRRHLFLLSVSGPFTTLWTNVRQSIASEEGAVLHLRQAVGDVRSGSATSLSSDLSSALTAMRQAGSNLQATRAALQHVQ